MVTNNIVNLLKAGPLPIILPLGALDSYHGIRMIGYLMRTHINSGKSSAKQLARKANLCAATVSKLASGETKSPRLHTILAILAAMGFSAVRFD